MPSFILYDIYINHRHFLLFERADLTKLPRRFAPRNGVCFVAKDLRWRTTASSLTPRIYGNLDS